MKIRREDVDHVREQSRIEDVVGEYVTLKAAGVGSLKGLCPFHDERTPSFHVRPHVGLWHCFGCSEGGDVISFVQKIDHLGFAEAVERLAARLGYEVRYEDDGGAGGGGGRRERGGQRQRLVEANRVAAAFYVEQLMESGEAAAGRRFLGERGFDRDVAEQFGIGFAPRDGEAALRHLRGRGFTEDELLSSGLAGQGRRGLYDRFRGRVLWPIRSVSGEVVGFGARRIFDDDRIEAKYLNTPDTALYRKSQVLYGVDMAKREIARARRVVVVEGYTDVMACHLAGVGTAVATCGTAFGEDHIRIVRRLLGDDSMRTGEVIFTFDGDEAGQKAAMRAFEDDQRFVAQTYVAVAREGMDPCDLRQQRGDEAVRELVDRRQPLFEFAIRTRLASTDLDTPEGRVAGLRVSAPMVARIRDSSLRPEYARQLAGWLGMEVETVLRAVRSAERRIREEGPAGPAPRGADRHPGRGPSSVSPVGGSPAVGGGSGGEARDAEGAGAVRRVGLRDVDRRDPGTRVQLEALKCFLQVPRLLPVEEVDALPEDAFAIPAFRAVHQAMRAAGGLGAAVSLSTQAWADTVRERAPEAVQGLVTELAVAPLPADSEDGVSRYAVSVTLHLVEQGMERTQAELHSRMQRMPLDDPSMLEMLGALQDAERRRRALQERWAGL